METSADSPDHSVNANTFARYARTGFVNHLRQIRHISSTAIMRDKDLVLQIGLVEVSHDMVNYHMKMLDFETDETIGFATLKLGGNRSLYWWGNVGYEVLPGFRGRRLAARTCLLLLRMAKCHGISKLFGCCAPENVASWRTMEIAGATRVGEEEINPKEAPKLAALGQTKLWRYKWDLSEEAE